MISIERQFKQGDRVQFRGTSVCVPKQYLPANAVGTVKSSYFRQYGVSIREELEIEFLIARDISNSLAPPFETVLRDIPAEQVERAL